MKAILIEFKLYFILAFGVALLAGAAWAVHHERDVGRAEVQAKWDLAVAQQNRVAVAASEKARTTEHQRAADFSGAVATYIEVTAHADSPFTLPAALAAGTLKLRDDCPAAGRSDVSAATARSRAADEAATEALSKRVEAASTVVRVGHASDARERQLGAQVTALQDVLRAERKP
ncbi:MAG: hypothetical protein ABI268_09920 [Rhodanobacter sp.]